MLNFRRSDNRTTKSRSELPSTWRPGELYNTSRQAQGLSRGRIRKMIKRHLPQRDNTAFRSLFQTFVASFHLLIVSFGVVFLRLFQFAWRKAWQFYIRRYYGQYVMSDRFGNRYYQRDNKKTGQAIRRMRLSAKGGNAKIEPRYAAWLAGKTGTKTPPNNAPQSSSKTEDQA